MGNHDKRITTMGGNGGFEIACVFCKTRYGYKNYDFKDFLFHLKDFHFLTMHASLALSISDLNEGSLEFLYNSLVIFLNFRGEGKFQERIPCLFCEKVVLLVRECSGEFRPSAMESHLQEAHLVVYHTDLFVNLSILTKPRLKEIVEAVLLKNPF